MNFRDGAPRPGERLPQIDLPTAEGGRFRTSEATGRPVLLVTGSYTCPMTASSNPLLKDLHDRFGDRIDFVMLYVREAHPGELKDQARTAEQKRERARTLQERDGLPWTIAVDDPNGSTHRRFDEKPNAAYLTDRNGTIVYRSLWAGDVHGLEEALEAVARGKRPRHSESRCRLVPMARGVGTMREMTRRAGPRAQRDIMRAAPPMGVMAWVADLYSPLPPAWRTAAAAATIAAGAAVLVTIIAQAASRR